MKDTDCNTEDHPMAGEIVYMGDLYGDHREGDDARAIVVEGADGGFTPGYISHGERVSAILVTGDLKLAAKHAETFTEMMCGPAPVRGRIGDRKPKRERPMYGFAELGKALA